MELKKERNINPMIINRLKELLAEQFEVDESTITESTDIMADLGADSLDIVEFIMMVEEEFDINIADEQSYETKTVGEVADYIESLMN